MGRFASKGESNKKVQMYEKLQGHMQAKLAKLKVSFNRDKEKS